MTTQSEDVEEFVELIERIARLADLPRTGWLASGVEQPESVAAHSYEVAVVALWLADRIEAQIDTERVLRIALLHDATEALLTDLPKPVKDLLGDEAIEGAEARATGAMFAELGEGWRDAVEEYRAAETPEARVVKAADTIQMMAKSLTYDAQHRGDVRRFWEARDGFDDYGFELVSEIFERLRAAWEAGDWGGNDFQ